ncbi:MFS transporter [Plantactinospora siamensis]|uniref:MFS transporter n=1 Tax=Plantactinospora siamensis TaxID=555372 RepID=A0ABV6NYN2_9ACTN
MGGPLLGAVTDRRGPRGVLVATVAVQALFWFGVPGMPYGVLLCAAFLGGLSMVPVQLVTRQAIAAVTTPGQRQAAFALESVQGEVAYLIGPSVVILGAATVAPGVVAWGVGALIAAGGLALAALNPPLRAAAEEGAGAAGRPPRREWLGAPMVAVLTMIFGTTTLLGGVDLAIIASLREAHQLSWAAVVVAVFGLASVAGGLSYGAQSRPLPGWLLLGLLGLATVPVGLAHDWPWLGVAVVGAGLLTGPTLAAMAHTVSWLAPAGARGAATGLQSAAHSAGFALGAPIVGVVIDAAAPAGGFAAAGLAGLAAALIGWLLSRRVPAADSASFVR